MPPTRAQPPLDFITPQLKPWLVKYGPAILPWWIKSQTAIAKIEVKNLDILTQNYIDFKQGKTRLLLAFRHPSVNDPLCMGYLFWQPLAKALKTASMQPPPISHSHFLYDRGIPLWGGAFIEWLFPRLGGTSIQRGKLDRPGLRSARELMLNAEYPLAAAPEGATNGHNEIISPLEPGIAQLGFWCAEDLQKAGRSEQVIILPVGIQYFYLSPPWINIEVLLSQLEIDCGIVPDPAHDLTESSLYKRLYQLGEVMLDLMENFYRQFYHKALPTVADLEKNLQENLKELEFDQNQLLALRLQNLLNAALTVAEEFFQIKARGILPDRCRRLEQAGWDYIYREELREQKTLSAVQIGLADRLAEESDLRMWHMRLVENFVAVTGHYVREKPSVERFADTLLLLWNVVDRMKGKEEKRPNLGRQRAQITIGEPIKINEYFADYKINRKQAIATLTDQLQRQLAQLIC
ncbi:MAG: 1-acyl-sn-glycerol-3-phosphate acyltransferase [Synechocystis sp.]